MSLPRSVALSIILFGPLLSIGCRYQPSGASSELATEAENFKIELLASISGAHQIFVVEHSWRCDFFDAKGDLVEDPPHIEYKRVELTPAQRTAYEAAFTKMPDTPKTAFSLCMFEPHHTIELVDEDGGKSFIQVCFKCGDTEWDGRSVVPPNDFQEVFRSLIEPSGFQADREWVELANNQAQQASAGNP
jgi:hypothetical protein